MQTIEIQAPRYSDVNQQKADGSTYTPLALAEFVAKQMLSATVLPPTGKIRILDPAVGDGILLEALIRRLSQSEQERVEVVGYDIDPVAIQMTKLRFSTGFRKLNANFKQKNFLEQVLLFQQDGALQYGDSKEKFHLVIANPPYVRTQVMGAEQAQRLAEEFGLTGRVDLYYAFFLGISRVLADGGITGVITSNRFMTTKAGQAVRRELLARFHVLHVWDLGDTKLFDAAVLPSVLLARSKCGFEKTSNQEIGFSTIYETQPPASSEFAEILPALDVGKDDVITTVDGRGFCIQHGILDNGGEVEGIWRIATQDSDQWLETVRSNTWETFRRIGKIRVGVKSTADKVFIRTDWDTLPEGQPELLRPLITRHHARRFKADVPTKAKHLKKILYPHEVTASGRGPVDLSLYPIAKQYLEKHRGVLEARQYVIDAGRRWYEIWVPQDPSAWPSPKLVFPDISDKPIFWIDTDGGIVNGECYWLQCENKNEEDLLWLALAVANSSFIEAFYDHCFNNKLYAGRRRFITQYVELFPLPDPERVEAKVIVALAKEIHSKIPSVEAEKLEIRLDEMIWDVFGLNVKKIIR